MKSQMLLTKEKMQKSLIPLAALVAVTLMIIPGAFAKGAGACYHGQEFAERTCYNSENAGGGGERFGTCQLIETGTPMEISGVVSEVCTGGQGIKVDTGRGIITVYGLGPIRYWTETGIDRPTVGEDLIIKAVEVTFSDDSTKIIALDITVVASGETIDLRDDSGLPLWRGGKSHRIQKRDCLE